MQSTPRIEKAGLSSPDDAFRNFVQTLRPSLKLWGYFVNWDKVFRNTRELEIHLNVWNYLLGKAEFETEFDALLTQHPEIVRALPSLVVRDGAGSQKYSVIQNIKDLNSPEAFFDFTKPADSPELRRAALEFVEETGLKILFSQEGVKNLVDYVLGVEAGVDSNARKNRSGTAMETVVSEYLKGFSAERNVSFISQATAKSIMDKWGFEIPVDKSTRRFDFAISDGKKLVLMEVNFYGGGGSKLKATAGEYIGLGELLDVPQVDFVWVTDGQGWLTTLNPMKAAYEKLDYVWNLHWLGQDFLEDLFL
jgi:type II restriction enzyme